MGKTWVWSVCLVTALIGVATGCGDSSEPDAANAEHPSFVGTVEGNDAFVGVVLSGGSVEQDEAVVYVCNGDEEISEWFQGSVSDPAAFQLEAESGATVEVKQKDGEVSGEFVGSDGIARSFSAEPAVGDAGIYRVVGDEAAEEELFAAWVVDNDGNERGAIRRSGTFQPTSKLVRSGFTSGGTVFSVATVLLPGDLFPLPRRVR